MKIIIKNPFAINDDRLYHDSTTSWNESVVMPQNQVYLPV